MKTKFLYIILVLALVLSLATVASAQQGGFDVQPGAVQPDSSFSIDTEGKSPAPAPSALPDIAGRAATLASAGQLRLVPLIVTFDSSVDAYALAAAAGGEVSYTYSKVFNGAALAVPQQNVGVVAGFPGVSKVFADVLLQPDTEVSPGFIGAPTAWTALGGQESAGEGVVVGVLDTGIWPEHPSFSDPDPSGKPFAAPPGGPYDCDFGNTAWNANDAPFTCNNKLIGAYEFLSTYKAIIGLEPEEFDSARDDNGHGTHTSSTSAGNAGVDASIFGVERGIVSGISPRSHVIMYRVCALEGCYSSDSAAAVEQAILDGVDVINFSISGGGNPFADAVSLAFLDAFNSGVFVAASAGNAGPGADTTDHREPWVTTVAASTGPRAFQTTATILGSGGASMALTGTTITAGAASAPVFVPDAASVQCNTPFAAGSVSGMIVVCQRGVTGRVQKGWNVLQGGASGMILYNQSAAVTDLETDNHFLPAMQIQFSQGQSLLTFLAANPGATASWPDGAAVPAQGDVMASFSSRGGPGQSLGISKPDITAPGVQILAGMTPMPVPPELDPALGPAGEYFQAIAGTSMSSPHIAGSGALIKALHPSWSPAQIKSALMTTAYGGVVKEDGVTPATPFDDGSGRVDLNLAGNPGLTFNESGDDYVALASQLWNSNYPSLYVPVFPGKITVQRTVTSVLPVPSNWTTWVQAPPDVKVTVPAYFNVQPGGDYTFDISVDAGKVPLNDVRFATLYMTTLYGKKQTPITLKFPITIVRKQPVVTLSKGCDPSDIVGLKKTTTCSVSVTNTSFDEGTFDLVDNLSKEIVLVRGSVTGGTQLGPRKAGANGTLFGAEPPDVTVAPGPTPAGYLPLSLFGVAPIGGMTDESIANFNVPSFMFAGVTYSRLGIVSNGYVVVGGGTGGDVSFINQILPNSARPNNVLAPFWTDLNPSAGGAIRIATLTDGIDTWIVVDFAAVKEYSSANTTSFQIWIRIGSTQDITYAFGPVTGNGDLGFLTVGAENSFGNRGQNYYADGVGTLPAEGTELVVSSVPAAPGETHTMTYQAMGVLPGTWTNCAEATSSLFQGTNVVCFSGTVSGNFVKIMR